MHKAFLLPVKTFHCQKKFLPLVKKVPPGEENQCHCCEDCTATKVKKSNYNCSVVYKDSLSYKKSPLVIVEEINQQNPTLAKIPIMDTGKFEQWQFRIQQYLQHEHYALWEVIEFGDSYDALKDDVTTASATDETGKKKGRTVTLTSDDIKHKTAQELWDAILKTFGGNEATK
nr:hypothetical protein [Tanacetum cinerariifolium]